MLAPQSSVPAQAASLWAQAFACLVSKAISKPSATEISSRESAYQNFEHLLQRMIFTHLRSLGLASALWDFAYHLDMQKAATPRL